MKVKIEKSTARGVLNAPPSKSMAHRLLIAAGLAEGESRICGVSTCDDALATMDCLRALGAEITVDGDDVTVRGIDPRTAVPRGALVCRESGSTLRFFVPICLLSGAECRLVGTEKLMSRPLSVYEQICRERGFDYRLEDTRLTVSGRLTEGDIYLPGDVSSQFITGLLLALPFCEGDSRIHITTKIESRSYIDMTLAAMAEFSVKAFWEDGHTLLIPGNQRYLPRSISVEGDYSGAAFLLALDTLGGEVTVEGLCDDSTQGDKVCRELLSRLAEGYCEISVEDCPDLAPILFTVAAALHGGRFTDTRRLRIKESDRAAVMAEELGKFGADIRVLENEVEVRKCELHTPSTTLLGHNDHRVVMSLAALSTLFGGVIDGAEAISKSYPDFFCDIERLGIKVQKDEI